MHWQTYIKVHLHYTAITTAVTEQRQTSLCIRFSKESTMMNRFWRRRISMVTMEGESDFEMSDDLDFGI